jgi:hypothetical protein
VWDRLCRAALKASISKNAETTLVGVVTIQVGPVAIEPTHWLPIPKLPGGRSSSGWRPPSVTPVVLPNRTRDSEHRAKHRDPYSERFKNLCLQPSFRTPTIQISALRWSQVVGAPSIHPHRH